MALKQISVPDVGEAESIELVEVLVAAGDVVKQNQSLVVLESDKASVELPAAFDGVVVAVLITPGMTVKEGDVLLTIETSVSTALTEAESEGSLSICICSAMRVSTSLSRSSLTRSRKRSIVLVPPEQVIRSRSLT